MNQQRLLLYSSKWQALRTGWLKAYCNDGGWTTELGTLRALVEMNEYLLQAPGEEEQLVRYWQVINCLNAVRMGNSGQKLSGTKVDLSVESYRNSLQEQYKSLQERHGKPNLLHLRCGTVEEFGERTLREFVKLTPPVRARIIKNLGQRRKLHEGREELAWYLNLVSS